LQNKMVIMPSMTKIIRNDSFKWMNLQIWFQAYLLLRELVVLISWLCSFIVLFDRGVMSMGQIKQNFFVVRDNGSSHSQCSFQFKYCWKSNPTRCLHLNKILVWREKLHFNEFPLNIQCLLLRKCSKFKEI